MKPINMPERAGHDHAIRGNLPAGVTYHPPPDLQSGASYYIDGVLWKPQYSYNGQALTRVLGPKSVVTLKFPDPKYATSIALPLQYSGAGNCNGAETRYLDIMVPGLVPLPPSANYVLVGGKKGHTTHYSYTHHGTVGTVEALKRLAARWRAAHPNSNKLVFNDISLPWGGAFDLNGDWNPQSSHYNHSFGVAADVSKLCVRKSLRDDLIRLMGEMGFTVRSEGSPTISTSGVLQVDLSPSHYHIQFQPEINRLMATTIPGSTIKFPINKDGIMNGVKEDSAQTDNGRGVFWDMPDSRNTKNCQEFMSYANNCKNPAGKEERQYCHCIGLYSGLTPISEKDEEPHGYNGCP